MSKKVQTGADPAPKKKKMKWWQIALIVIVVLAIIGAIAGGGSKDKDNDKELTIGVPGEYKGLEVTVLSFSDFEPDNDFFKPDEGKKFVQLEVAFKNNGDTQVSINSMNWKLKTANGELFGADDLQAKAAHGNEIKLMDLAPEGNTSGYIAFQVPADTAIEEALHYKNMFDDKPVLEFKLK